MKNNPRKAEGKKVYLVTPVQLVEMCKAQTTIRSPDRPYYFLTGNVISIGEALAMDAGPM